MTALAIDIATFVRDCEAQLLTTMPMSISYADKVALKNNTLPNAIELPALNIYALWLKPLGSTCWTPVYIGQRSQSQGWARVKQHLFHTHGGTQSKLHLVRKALDAGSEIGVTGILVEPDSLRLTIEDELIFRNTPAASCLPWNDKSRNMPLNGRGKPANLKRAAQHVYLEATARAGYPPNESK